MLISNIKMREVSTTSRYYYDDNDIIRVVRRCRGGRVSDEDMSNAQLARGQTRDDEIFDPICFCLKINSDV